MFNVGDKVKFNACPFDEQIADQAMLYAFLKTGVFTVTEIQRVFDEGSSSQWIKTDHTPDWIDSNWFNKAE